MVLDEPMEVDEDLVPSFKESDPPHYGASEMTVSILKEYETKVVPNIIELNWMSEVAKSRSKPYYNRTDQNINGHIFPGIEVIVDVVESVSYVDNAEIRNLISLWTVHDIHKILDDNGDEFSISAEQVSKIVDKLNLNEFNGDLTVSDYQSCSVALHNSNPSKIDDSTTKFTTLRPILRLTDLITSVSKPSDFTDQAERLVMKVFGTENTPYIPSSHTIDMKDSIMQKIVNKSVHSILTSKGYNSIDIRGNGVMYVRQNDSDRIQNPDFIEKVVSVTFSNIRDVYQKYSNRSLLGSDIETPQSRVNYNKPPRVYDVSNLSKICLSKEEIVQRIVQATVEHQNRPYRIPKESESQIDKLNSELDTISIEKNMFVEGMAAMVHTFYKDVLPDMIQQNSEYAFERTLEGSILHLFNCSRETQRTLLDAMSSDSIHASKIEWPYKYIIAQELHERYSSEYSRTERRDMMTELILDRVRMFDNWSSYTDDKYDKVWDEFYTRIASKLSVNGEKIMESPDVNVIDKLSSEEPTGECYLCGTVTSESPLTPSLLSNNDFDILEEDFTSVRDTNFENVNLNNSVPENPICSVCQFGLSARSQQISKDEEDDSLVHLTIHSMNSGSVASVARFNKILQLLQTDIFADNSSLYNPKLGTKYQNMIEDYLQNRKNLRSMTNRKRLLCTTSHRDAVTSSVRIPSDSQESKTKLICCIATAAMISGVRVLITKHPQINIPAYEMRSILNISDDLEFFDNLLRSQSSIESLVSELKVADRVIRVGSEVNSVSSVMNYYDDIDDNSVLVGSQLYGRIKHMMKVADDPSKITKSCVNLDSIVSESDGYSKQILSICSSISTPLTDVVTSEDIQDYDEVIDRILDEIRGVNTDINKNEVYSRLTVVADELDYLELESLEGNTSTDRLCHILSDLLNNVSSGVQPPESKMLNIAKNCISLQVMLTGDNHGR